MPVSDYTFNDCKLMTRAKRFNIPQAAHIVEIDAHRRTLGYLFYYSAIAFSAI